MLLVVADVKVAQLSLEVHDPECLMPSAAIPVFVGHPGEQGGEAVGGALDRAQMLGGGAVAAGLDCGDPLGVAAGAPERRRVVGVRSRAGLSAR